VQKRAVISTGVNYEGKFKNKIYLNYPENKPIMRREGLVENFVVTIAASLILIFMGMIYFIVTLLIVKFSSALMGYSPDANWVVISAAIIVAGIMIGSAIKNV